MPKRVHRIPRLLAGPVALAALAMLATLPVRAQVHEEDMEPAELGIVDLDSLTVPSAHYVGNDACAECHPDAYRTWLGTKHSRTYVWLESDAARAVAKAAGIMADSPRHSGFCLGCHATAADVAAKWREAGFRMAEGVACEKCHGPGGAHVQARREGVPEEAPLRRPDERFCLGCHHRKPSHETIPTNGHFTFEKYWKEIAHSEPEHE
jgi:Cytochrome c554 and c-prime